MKTSRISNPTRKKFYFIQDFNWVKYLNNIIGYDNDKNIFYRFNVFNTLFTFSNTDNLFININMVSISEKERNYLIELKTRNLIEFKFNKDIKKYFNRIKVINTLCAD